MSDHHAIVPTPNVPRDLDREEKALYDLVARRLLAAWHDEHVAATTTVVTAVRRLAPAGTVDRFRSTGTMVVEAGVEGGGAGRAVEEEGRRERGGRAPRRASRADSGRRSWTWRPSRGRRRPPKRFTDATLLTAMETAGKTLDEKELAEAMRENGLGTPATRAEILETLLQRGYVERNGKALRRRRRRGSVSSASSPSR